MIILKVQMSKKPTKYFRIATIANYLEWLCKIHLSHTGQKDTLKYILDFINNIKRKKPRNNDKYNMDIEKSLNNEQLDSLFSILAPGSKLNPFQKKCKRSNPNIPAITLLWPESR